MKSLYKKYQSNKHLFVIPLLILVLGLYFIPTAIRLFENMPITYLGFFYSWFGFNTYMPYLIDMANAGESSALISQLCSLIFPLIITIASCVFAGLCYKNILFAVGTIGMPLQNVIMFIILLVGYKNTILLPAEKGYFAFYFILNVFVLAYMLMLFCLPFYIKEKPHKPTKSDRIAELEKQVAELRSKLPSEND